MPSPYVRLALVLGFLSAIGPFAIDMYLPALPAIGRALHADDHAVQLSLAAFFVAFALSQVVYGPASDIHGRRVPLLAGLALFVAGSVGCALAPDIAWLVALRFVQGLGAGAPAVVPRAVVRDLHTGTEAARLMSLLMLVLSVSPMLAPLAGSLLIGSLGWRAIFAAVAGLGIAALVLAAAGLDETRPAAQRRDSSVARSMQAFGSLLRDARFIGLTAVSGFAITGFFAYLAHSSFVFIGHYGLTPQQYSLAFAVNAASFIGVSQFTGRLAARFGLARVMGAAAVGHAVVMVALLAVLLGGFDALPVLVVGCLLGFGFTGLVIPAASVLALDEHGEIAGSASALMGTLQMVIGALGVAALSHWADGTPGPMVAGIAAAAVCAMVCAALTLRTTRSRAPAAPELMA